MERERLGDHRLAGTRRSDEEEVPPLSCGDSREGDRLVLADNSLQRVVRDRNLGGRLEVIEGESFVDCGELRSRDRSTPPTERDRSASKPQRRRAAS